MKIAKWVAGIGVGLLAVIALAVVTLTMLVDPNRFRGRIEAAVREATGRPFQLQGDLEIAWFPWLSVQTGQAQLGNPPGVSGPPLARWKSARVGVRLLPLIHGELDIDRIRIEGLSTSLRRAADGRANWDDLLASNRADKPRRRTAPRMAGLEIRDSAVDFVDEKAGAHFRLSRWNLEVGPVELTPTLDRATIHGFQTNGTAFGGPLPKAGVPFATQWPEVKASFAPLDIVVPKWSVKLADAQLAGAISVKKEVGRLSAAGPLSVQIPSARKFLAALGFEAPLPKDTTAMGPLSLQASWSFTDGALALKPIALKLDETSFAGELARSNAAEPLWTFELHGDRIDLRRYLITEDTSDEPFELPVKTLKALRVQGTLHFDQARFADADMKNARLRVQSP